VSERAITDSIRRLLTRRGAWHFKTHGTGMGRVGIPDIIAVYKGRPLALEVKQPGRRPTAIQNHELQSARRAGAIAAVVYDTDEVRRILDAIDNPEVQP
jgi:Holliday junction resolvase